MSIDIERWNTDPKYRAAYKGEVCRHCGWPPGECICLAGPSVPSTDPPAVLLRDTPEDRERLARADCELESDEIKEPYRAIHMEQHYETADRIIAALRGER